LAQVTDPFDTAAIRDRVLSSWAASPVRFREDANQEEDFALGGYRDRLIVELAQNAADAAARAGERGRLRLVLRTGDESPVLVAANTGEPLTAEGVESLATLRASAKRADESTVGRFGVGFAAVLAVTDEPMVLSRTGGVRFSRQDTAELVAEVAASAPGLAAEVRRREGHVPVLRLPCEAEGEPPKGFDSAVVLPLRDQSAVDVVRRLLADVADPLLLALPALGRIECDVDGEERVLADVDRRWRVRGAKGRWTPAERDTLLADRPTEERARATWSVLWAIPRSREVTVHGDGEPRPRGNGEAPSARDGEGASPHGEADSGGTAWLLGGRGGGPVGGAFRGQGGGPGGGRARGGMGRAHRRTAKRTLAARPGSSEGARGFRWAARSSARERFRWAAGRSERTPRAWRERPASSVRPRCCTPPRRPTSR